MRSLSTHTKNAGRAAALAVGFGAFGLLSQLLGRMVNGSRMSPSDIVYDLFALPIGAAIIGFLYSMLRDVPPSRGRSGLPTRLVTGAVAGAIGGTLTAGLRFATGTTYMPFLIGTIGVGSGVGVCIGLGAYLRAR